MRNHLIAVRTVAVAAALVLVAAACSVGAGTDGEATTATIGFVSPSDGGTICVRLFVVLV
jgi:hypothetical protein